MKSYEEVNKLIAELLSSGIPLGEAAWKLALACVGWPYIFGDRGNYCTPSHRKAVYNGHPDQEGLITKCQVLNGKKSSCSGCQWYPGGKKVLGFDCRGFTYWILYKIYGWKLMGAGATTQWNNDSNWKEKGTIDTLPRASGVPICLFYKDKKKPNVMAHTGLYYNGETCECSNGVQHFTSLNKKWTHWAIPKCVDISPEPTPGGNKPTLRKGDKGVYVTLLQTELINRGYSLPKYGADGSFGNETLDAVKKFQKDNGLTADGVVGKTTWAALDGSPAPQKLYIVVIPHLTREEAEELFKEHPGTMTPEE